MATEDFLNLGKQIHRNIINSQDVNQTIKDIIAQKKLADYPNIILWLETVVKNNILQKEPLISFDDKNLLSTEIQDLINRKNISSPYHEVQLTQNKREEIFHCVDYLQSAFPNTKDLSRISLEQALINTRVWLSNRLKKLTTEEDEVNVIPVLEFEHDEQAYRWVNIRSQKGLERESKMMNHCIETYWNKNYPNKLISTEETGFYSLRDNENTPMVTLYGTDPNNSGEKKANFNYYELSIDEVKEKNNALLTHKNRELVDKFMEVKKCSWLPTEAYNSHYYIVLLEGYKTAGQYVSINKIINEKRKFLTSHYLDINDFVDYFPKEKLLGIGNWKKIVIKQGDNIANEKDDMSKLYAQNVSVSDYDQKKLIINSTQLIATNITNSALILNNTKKTSNTIRFFSNVVNSSIILLEDEPGEVFYIFKDCKNIELSINKMNLKDLNKPPVNIIKVNCNNIVIDLPATKNILSVDKQDNINYSFNGQSGTGNDLIYNSNKEINSCLSKMLNNYKICHVDSLEEDTLLYKFAKQFKIQLFNSVYNKHVLFNNYKNNGDYKENILELLKNPLGKIEEVFNMFEEQTYSHYNKFIIENAYTILQDKILHKLPQAKKIIDAEQDKIRKNVLNNRNELIKVLIGTDDNFAHYFFNVLDYFNVLDKPTTEYRMYTELAFYMLKNEIIEQALIHANETVSYRFSVEEKKIRGFIGKRWARFMLDTDNVDHLSIKGVTNILIQPFDNNSLLKNLKDDNILLLEEFTVEKNKYKMKV